MTEIDRRRFLAGGAATFAATALPTGARADMVQLPFANGDRPLIAFSQKHPLLSMTPRPPQLETPFAIFDNGVYTPNDAFFVHWHLANVLQSVDATAHRIAVTGEVSTPLSLSLGGQSMLRKRTRVVIAARRRRAVGQRRDGRRAHQRSPAPRARFERVSKRR